MVTGPPSWGLSQRASYSPLGKNFDQKSRNPDGSKLRQTLPKRIMRLGTWNIQGNITKQAEVFKELQEKNIDICILTETKKKGKGTEIVNIYISTVGSTRINEPKGEYLQPFIKNIVVQSKAGTKLTNN